MTLEGKMAVPEHRVVYKILVSWAKRKHVGTYLELTNAYAVETGVGFEAHGTWDDPLGAINNIAVRWDAPAISSLVVLQSTFEPGGGFWGCAANVPARPKVEDERLKVLSEIQKAVHAYDWPATLDGPSVH
jgi:hypothetical protein